MDAATEALAIAAAACTATAAIVGVVLHLLPTGRDPLVDPVSDYGIGRFHAYHRAMVVLLGVGAGLLVAGLARQGGAESGALAFIAAFAAARVAIAFFTTDPLGGPHTPEGRVHLVLAAVAFTAIAFGSSDVTSSLDGQPGWSGSIVGVMRFEARIVAVAAVATAACLLAPMLRERLFGAVERVLYVATLAWLITTAAHLATLAG